MATPWRVLGVLMASCRGRTPDGTRRRSSGVVPGGAIVAACEPLAARALVARSPFLGDVMQKGPRHRGELFGGGVDHIPLAS